LPLIPIKTWRKFSKAVHNGYGMKSILECYYQQVKIGDVQKDADLFPIKYVAVTKANSL
jgi:hypothetical protein